MATQRMSEELARESGFEDLSFATRSYRPEYASSPDIHGAYRPERWIRTSEIEPALRAKLAFTSGGKDRQGRRILTIPAGKTEDLSVNKLGDTLAYLTQVPRDQGRSQIVTVIIDLRGSSWKSAKPLLRTLQDTIPDKVHEVYIIKPDAFWEKRRSGSGLKQEQSNFVFETTLLSSSSKLHQFAEESQLTQELGGTLPYNHDRWIDTRLEIDRLSDDAISVNEKFDELEQHLDTHRLGMNLQETDALIQEHKSKRAVLDSVGNPLIQRGEHLISSIKANEPPVPPSQNFPGSPALVPSQELQQVETIVTQLTHRCNQLTDMWEKRWKELMQCMDLREFEAGYKKVIDWVFGSGEAYLSTSRDIGDSVITCEILRKEHEEFELNAREVINHFAQVRELAKKMLQENHYASKDIKTQKEFLDRGCRSFAMRMNRRRDIILTSLRFHKSAGECSVHLDDLFELLCSDSVLLYDYETAESMLKTLEEKAEAVAVSSEETLRDAMAAQELMTSPVVDMRGDDVTPDYSKGIAHVRLTLDELRERKLRTDELCDVRRIKLQQLLQLKQSERDAEQATAWISQLRDATEHNLGDVGRNSEDVEGLQQEHEKLEATSRSTYDYGRQFLQTSLVLRRTCRYELSPNYEMEEKLNNAWSDFSSVMAERGARLSVALMFHRSAEKLVQQIEELRDAYLNEELPEDLTAAAVEQEISRHSDTRHAIDKEYAETVAMGKALIDRMQLPPLYGEDGEPNRPPHLLEECLMDLEDRKIAWERVWKDRDERLHHWLKLGDYEQEINELLQWVKDRTNETEENRHRIGENLAEAEALSVDLQELEARLKVCVARNALFGEDGRVHRDLTAYTWVHKHKSLPKQAVAVTKVM